VCTQDGWTGPLCSTENLPVVVQVNSTIPTIGISTTTKPPSSPKTNITNNSTSSSSPTNSGGAVPLFLVTVKQIIEFDTNNKEVTAYNLTMGSSSNIIIFNYTTMACNTYTQSKYNAALPNGAALVISLIVYNTSQSVVFANQTMFVQAQTVKVTVNITNWSFSSLKNTLAVVFDSSFQGSSSAGSSNCNLQSQQSDDAIGALQWIQIQLNNTILYGQFLPKALVDMKPKILTSNYVENSMKTGGEVYMISPHFWDSLVIDPNYSILVDDSSSSNNGDSGDCSNLDLNSEQQKSLPKTMLIGIVVGVAGAALVVAAILFVYKQKKQTKARRKLSGRL
jgi:hypothetical protein